MRIQYISDVHLEFRENASYIKHNPLPVTGEVLVIAGDTLYLGDSYTKHPFWDWASENYQQVIVCLGNHEFYLYYDLATMTDGRTIDIRPNVHAYYNKSVRVGDADIIVSTLWAHIPDNEAVYTERCISDFRRILYNGELFRAADFNHEHQRCFEFIKQAVAKSDARVKIVVSHHVPSFRMLCPKFADSLCNGGFTVELSGYIEKSGIDYWIFGHSHYNIDVRIGSTQCICNQLGYVFVLGEQEGFDAGKYIEI